MKTMEWLFMKKIHGGLSYSTENVLEKDFKCVIIKQRRRSPSITQCQSFLWKLAKRAQKKEEAQTDFGPKLKSKTSKFP